MSEIEVRIVRLAPQRVATTYGFGPGPEDIAWQKMIAFIKTEGFEKDSQEHRYFGFNNPDPSPGSPNYGYEQWVTISPETAAGDDVKIKDFQGGLYAVTRTDLETITRTWQKLVAWREKSHYRMGNHQWLEEALAVGPDMKITPQMELDLYLPITE